MSLKATKCTIKESSLCPCPGWAVGDLNTPNCIRIRLNNIYVYPGQRKTCTQNTYQFVRAALGKLFKSNCSWRMATGNHLHICNCHVYDDASAMTISSRTCLRAE